MNLIATAIYVNKCFAMKKFGKNDIIFIIEIFIEHPDCK